MTPSKKNIRKQLPKELRAELKSSSESFQIPEGYFQQLQNEVIAKCNDMEQKPADKSGRNLHRILWSAAASIALLVLAFTSFAIWKQIDSSRQFSELETDTYLFAEMLEDNFLSVSDVILYDLEHTFIEDGEEQLDNGFHYADDEWTDTEEYNDESDDYLLDYLMDENFFLMDYLDGNDI